MLDLKDLEPVLFLLQVDGFFTLMFGLSSINTLTVISVTRYIKGCHPNRGDGPSGVLTGVQLGSFCL